MIWLLVSSVMFEQEAIDPYKLKAVVKIAKKPPVNCKREIFFAVWMCPLALVLGVLGVGCPLPIANGFEKRLLSPDLFFSVRSHLMRKGKGTLMRAESKLVTRTSKMAFVSCSFPQRRKLEIIEKIVEFYRVDVKNTSGENLEVDFNAVEDGSGSS